MACIPKLASRRVASGLVLLSALAFAGCAPEAEPVTAAEQGLEQPAVPADSVRILRFDARENAVAAEIAQAKIERAQDVCGPCRSRACRMLCILGEDFERAAERPDGDGDDCLMCGRETGFLPRPDLRVEVLDGGVVRFDWDHVDGATEYQLVGVRWDAAAVTSSAESLEWRTDDLNLSVTLDLEARYTFSLTAWGDEARRSLPSQPVDVDL